MRFNGIILILVMFMMTGCGLLSFSSGAEATFCDDPVTAIETFGEVTLPDSYSSLNVRCSAFMDHHTLYARFTLSPADLVTFQQSTLIEAWVVQADTPPDFPYSFGDFIDKRSIGNLTNYIYGIYEPLVPVAQQVLIDTSDPQRYIVYFTAFTSY